MGVITCGRVDHSVHHSRPGYVETSGAFDGSLRAVLMIVFPGASYVVYRTSAEMVKDLLNPLPADEKRKHKLKRLVQSPNSFFMDVKCPGCFSITTVFSHAQVRITCLTRADGGGVGTDCGMHGLAWPWGRPWTIVRTI